MEVVPETQGEGRIRQLEDDFYPFPVRAMEAATALPQFFAQDEKTKGNSRVYGCALGSEGKRN